MHRHTSVRIPPLLALLAAAFMFPVRAAPAPAWGLGEFARPTSAQPVLGPRDTRFDCPMMGKPVAWEAEHVFNPAAVTRDGKVYLLYRAEDGSGQGIGEHTSRIGLAESVDGLHFTPRPAPVLYPDNDAQKKYEWPGGCEDPRVVESPDGEYVMTYTAWDRKMARLSVATSRDLVHWKKHGPVFAQSDGGRFLDLWSKSGAVVTKRVGDRLIAATINGSYWMLWGEGKVRAATSDDLIHWKPVLDKQGEPVVVLAPRAGRFDSALCEPGPPAVWTKDGIILLYNGKNAADGGDPDLTPGAYSGGQALLDARNPVRVLARDDEPFIRPERSCEATGQYAAGTVFLEGIVHFKDRWFIYYGAADSKVGAAVAVPRSRRQGGSPARTGD